MSKNDSVFMVITHRLKPIAGANMSSKTAAANPDNWETTESMILVDRVPKAKIAEASIIMDLLNGKVTKNRFDVADVTVFREYVNRYTQDVTDALKMWGARSVENFSRLKSIAEEIEVLKKGELDVKANTN